MLKMKHGYYMFVFNHHLTVLKVMVAGYFKVILMGFHNTILRTLDDLRNLRAQCSPCSYKRIKINLSHKESLE